jgi:hypothetical protein
MVLAIAVLASLGIAATTATNAPAADDAPAPDEAPAPKAMAPIYLAVGKNLLVRVELIRRTLNDLTLDKDHRKQADQIIDAVSHEIQYLMGEIEAGRMPSAKRIADVPMDLQIARGKLTEVIGVEQNQSLLEKLRSVRGEARREIGQVRQAIDDLKTSDGVRHGCDEIVADADAGAEKLPDCDLEGDQSAKARQSMIELMEWMHGKLCGMLTAQQQSELGASFAALAAKGAATEPSSG